MASTVVIGAATGTADLQTVLDVAKGQQVTLDAATADRLKRESPAPKDFKPEADIQTQPTNEGEYLNALDSRAATFCRVISLALGSTKLRPAVLHSLVDILNSSAPLQLQPAATDSTALGQLADAAAKQATGTATAPGLSADERAVLQSGQAVTLGVAAVANQTSVQSLAAATAISSLSAEALQIQVLHTANIA